MHECDLYSDIRAKLIARLINAPFIQTHSESNNLRANPDIDNQTLKSNIMTLLSPYTVPDIDHIGTNLFNIHHKIKIDRNPSITPLKIKPHKPTDSPILSTVYLRLFIVC